MKEIILTENNFNNEVLEHNGTVLVDFYAEWCGPCKMLAPIIHEIAEECSNIKVGKLNVDEALSIALKYHVSSIPTLIVFKDGKQVNQMIGFASKEEIMKLLGAV